MTALVVDDAPEIRRLFSRVLRGRGMEVLESGCGDEALELAHVTRPDVVVTDIEMAGLNGIELCRGLRKDPTFENVLIVVVTGAATTRQHEAVGAGCDVVLTKPCSPALLLATIQRLLVQPS